MVLACTHYVALVKLIGEIFPKVRCHDPIPFLVSRKLKCWNQFEAGNDVFLTTGEVLSSGASAMAAFGVEADFEIVKL